MLLRRRKAVSVRLYGKPGCHLCDDAMRCLQNMHGEFVLSIEDIDITSDEAMLEELRERIPVIEFADERRLFAPIDEVQLRRALRDALPDDGRRAVK